MDLIVPQLINIYLIFKYCWAQKKESCIISRYWFENVIQLSWADEVCKYTGGDILILPLAVSKQTEGKV